MIYKVFVALCGAILLLVAGSAQACTPPMFPVPDTVRALEAVKQAGESLTVAEQDVLADYISDRTRYFERFEKLYPCHMNDTAYGENLSDDQRTRLREDMNRLEQRWAKAEFMLENSSEESAVHESPEMISGAYTVPAETQLIHFE